MRLLFDNGVPAPLRRFLLRHEVASARERGWAECANGRLIAAAEFEGTVTCDKNWAYRQNLAGWRLAFAVLPTNIWPDLQPHVAEIVALIDGLGQGEYRELDLPRPTLKRRPAPPRPCGDNAQ